MSVEVKSATSVIDNLSLVECADILAIFDKATVEPVSGQNALRLSVRPKTALWPDMEVRLFFHDNFGRLTPQAARFNGLDLSLAVADGKVCSEAELGRINASWDAANADECSSKFTLDPVNGKLKLKYSMLLIGGVTREHVTGMVAMIWNHSRAVDKFIG